jgi:hypothetical protein
VAVPSLVLVDIGQELLQPALYKDALISQNVYARVPELAAQQIVYAGIGAASNRTFLASVFDSSSTSVSSCLGSSLGSAAYQELQALSRPATASELDRIKTCLRVNGAPSTVSETVEGMPVYFWVLTESDWNGVMTSLLPPDLVRTQVETAIDQVAGAIASGRGSPLVQISLADFKTRVAGPQGLAAVEDLIDAQPPCTLDQLDKIATYATSGAPLGQIPVCRPPDAVMPIIRPSIQSALTVLARFVPDTAEVDLSGGAGGGSNPIGPAHDLLNLTRAAAWGGVGLALLLLLVGVALGARSVGAVLRWLGIPLAVAGALGLLVAVVTQGAAQGFITDRLPSSLGGTGTAPSVISVEVDTLNWIVGVFFGRLGVQSFALLATGSILAGAPLAVRLFARLSSASRINARSQPSR